MWHSRRRHVSLASIDRVVQLFTQCDSALSGIPSRHQQHWAAALMMSVIIPSDNLFPDGNYRCAPRWSTNSAVTKLTTLVCRIPNDGALGRMNIAVSRRYQTKRRIFFLGGGGLPSPNFDSILYWNYLYIFTVTNTVHSIKHHGRSSSKTRRQQALLFACLVVRKSEATFSRLNNWENGKKMAKINAGFKS